MLEAVTGSGSAASAGRALNRDACRPSSSGASSKRPGAATGKGDRGQESSSKNRTDRGRVDGWELRVWGWPAGAGAAPCTSARRLPAGGTRRFGSGECRSTSTAARLGGQPLALRQRQAVGHGPHILDDLTVGGPHQPARRRAQGRGAGGCEEHFAHPFPCNPTSTPQQHKRCTQPGRG